MGRKSCLYTKLEYIVGARLSAHTDCISCTGIYLAQYPRLPFGGVLSIQLIHLWVEPIQFRVQKNVKFSKLILLYCFLAFQTYHIYLESVGTFLHTIRAIFAVSQHYCKLSFLPQE